MSSTSTIPTFKRYSDFPEWVSLDKRLNELRGRKDGLLHRLNVASGRVAAQTASDPMAAARALLDDGRIPDGAVPESIEAGERKRLRQELEIVEQALELGEAQLSQLERQLNSKITAPLRAWHRGVVERMAKAAVELCSAARLEADLVGQLREAGIGWGDLTPSGGPSRPGWLGELNTNIPSPGNTAAWIRALCEEGVLDAKAGWVKAFLELDPEPAPYVPRSNHKDPEPAPRKRRSAFYA